MIANVDQSANAVETPLNRRGQVSLREVRKSYGALEVVKGIDLEIASGEFISLLGLIGPKLRFWPTRRTLWEHILHD